MNDEINAQLVDTWRMRLLNDPDGPQALRALAESNYAQFRAICSQLSKDTNQQVAIAALRRLGFAGAHNDAEADAVVRERLAHGGPALRDAALLALGRVGVPDSFPLLLEATREGSYVALYAIGRFAHRIGQEQVDAVVTLARQFALSPNGRLRGVALQVLRGLSTAEREEQLLLVVAAEYLDDDAFLSLRRASSAALPRLEAIRATLTPGSVEWIEVTKAIEQIQLRHQQPK